MLTKEENDFLLYWRMNREKHKKTIKQFLLGIPIGLALAIPIALNFVSGWYKRARMVANTSDFNPLVLLIALLIITGFMAVFYKRYQWDRNEQHYLELLAKKDKNPENEKK